MKTILLFAFLFLSVLQLSAQVLQPYKEEPVELPKQFALSINGGVATVKTTAVTLNIKAENVTEMMISNTKEFEGALWIPYAKEKKWMLTDGEGVKYIYIKFRNSKGEESQRIFKSVILWKQEQ